VALPVTDNEVLLNRRHSGDGHYPGQFRGVSGAQLSHGPPAVDLDGYERHIQQIRNLLVQHAGYDVSYDFPFTGSQ
jgi:hypothetical protein